MLEHLVNSKFMRIEKHCFGLMQLVVGEEDSNDSVLTLWLAFKSVVAVIGKNMARMIYLRHTQRSVAVFSVALVEK